ncbi:MULTISPECIES: DUF6277 family protein [Winslowiella]|uniref:DUF6277 family protein n=1 Tax=Winslowiella TaxID=2997349 RepID=UPI0028BF47EC|nr:DUF6277 family protein [Winslowiella toletana]WNN45042.1 DUF6277 family protein [Winslowiella toletana]
MLDPNKLLAMLTDLNSMAQTTQSSLSQNFMSGVSGMNLNGSAEMEKMMALMTDINGKATADMSGIMQNFQQNADMQQQSAAQQTAENNNEGKQSDPAAPQMSFPQGAMDFFSSLQKK